MTAKVQAIPEGYRSLSPAVTCKNAASAIDFYVKVFGGKELMRMPGPNNSVMHAEIQIGDSRLMVSDEFPGMSQAPNPQNPAATQGCAIFLYSEDVDGVVQRAVEAGSRVDMPVADQFWGDRYGKFTDPYGHSWAVATHVEDVSDEETARRMDAFSKQMAQAAGQ